LKTIPSFSITLLDWFEENQRALPWRSENDPYKIWVSEVILQQTRVNQGWNYYLSFIERFPDVKALADATLLDVLMMWQGLGYYSRARNMHSTAQQIMKDYHGHFPNNYLEIRKLKGIGYYTAAAISSIAFHLPYPALDGNVLRVISRIFGIYENILLQKTVKNISQLCVRLMDKKKPGLFNQALMEFGAIQCTPKNPKCEICPFDLQCIALREEHIHLLPLKFLNSNLKVRFFHYFIFLKENKTIIEQRTENDIWKYLYQFPMIETETACENPLKSLNTISIQFENEQPVFLKEIKHKLTHQLLNIRFYVFKDFFSEIKSSWITISVKELDNYPLPVVIKNIVKYIE